MSKKINDFMILDNNEQIVQIDKKIKAINDEILNLKAQLKILKDEKELLQQKANKDIQKKNITSLSSTNSQWTEKLKKTLNDTFKISNFRSLQLETMITTLNGDDCILIKPTGGGKSLCYQLPAILGKISIVVSPLVSLMQDQIRISQSFGISCIGLDASCPVKLQNEVFKSIQSDPIDNPKYRLIYVTPEKIAKSKKLMTALEKAYKDKRISRFVIDELHCCSQWGHDFRPDYKSLHIFKQHFTNIPVLGLTATASDRVIRDVKDILSLSSNTVVFRDHYNRPNLNYEVHYLVSEESESQTVCNLIRRRYKGQSGIVYCYTQSDCEKLCGNLVHNGIKAAFYHGNLEYEHRNMIHKKWLSEEYKVIVATIAFGMGIDKPNVRFVIHSCMSKSLDNYYQESGRAGRDSQSADCILLWKMGDYFKISTSVFPEKTGLYHLNLMCQYGFNQTLCRRTFLAPIFQDTYKSEDCDNKCDICSRGSDRKMVQIDICQILRLALRIINESQSKQKSTNQGAQTITGNRLANQLFDESKSFQAELNKKYSSNFNGRLFIEKSLVYLINEKYLEMHFSFGSFKNFVYIHPGTEFSDGIGEILMYFEVKVEQDINKTKNKEISKDKKIEEDELLMTFPGSSNKKKMMILVDSDGDSDDDFDLPCKIPKL